MKALDAVRKISNQFGEVIVASTRSLPVDGSEKVASFGQGEICGYAIQIVGVSTKERFISQLKWLQPFGRIPGLEGYEFFRGILVLDGFVHSASRSAILKEEI